MQCFNPFKHLPESSEITTQGSFLLGDFAASSASAGALLVSGYNTFWDTSTASVCGAANTIRLLE